LPALRGTDWTTARRAREALADRYLHDPDVRLIDLCYESGPVAERTVIRVHVRDADTVSGLSLPDTVDGVPVRVMVAACRKDG
jgi:hypothetical protein